MKKITSSLLFLVFSFFSYAGGLVTNVNQSTQYARTLSRNASTEIDAVYFNPAGLSKLDNGFHFSLNNQSIFQTKTITNDFYLLNQNTFEGNVSAPLFPSGFGVYKMNKLAFSFGFGPAGGGGSATFNDGLPSFDMGLKPYLAAFDPLKAIGFPVDNIGADITFEGSSIFWGFQLGATFEISEMISAFVGMRYINAQNKYVGGIRNISIEANGNFINGQQYVASAAALVQSAADGLGEVNALTGGSLTMGEIQGYVDPAVFTQMIGGLMALKDISQEVALALTSSQAQEVFQGTATFIADKGSLLGDKEVDVKQTGTGIAPIIGVNLTPVENLNIGMKYEFKTKLKLTNKTKQDDTGMFTDGDVTNNDIPALFAIGADYGITDRFRTSVSFNQYFDKGANWDGREKLINHGLWEASISLEYRLFDFLLVSGGVLHGVTGVMPEYQTDLSYSNSSNTVGAGFEIKISDRYTVNLGCFNAFYVKNQKDYYLPGFTDKITETYTKTTTAFSIGVDIKL